jgi:hypothetical protein
MLRTEGDADLPVDRHVGGPVLGVHGRGVVGDAGLEQPVLDRLVVRADAEVV